VYVWYAQNCDAYRPFNLSASFLRPPATLRQSIHCSVAKERVKVKGKEGKGEGEGEGEGEGKGNRKSLKGEDEGKEKGEGKSK
jgi:hypothetical protein